MRGKHWVSTEMAFAPVGGRLPRILKRNAPDKALAPFGKPLTGNRGHLGDAPGGVRAWDPYRQADFSAENHPIFFATIILQSFYV